jgi:hypothetical protein
MKGEAAKTHGLFLARSINYPKTKGNQRINIVAATGQLIRFQQPGER